MKPREVASLFVMGALWGGSFVFQRLLVPLYGPLPNTFLRLVSAGLALAAFCALTRQKVEWRGRLGVLWLTAVLTAALPYTLFAFGALKLSSAILAVLNATAPMFGAVFAVIWLKEKFTPLRLLGLGLGAVGVAMISQVWNAKAGDGAVPAVLACLLAAACYGLSGVVVKLRASDASAITLATSGQLIAGLTLAPLAAATWPAQPVPGWAWGMVVVFGVVCSALPYLLYMWLQFNVGPTRALTVTYLIPVFGGLWGWLLLREPLTLVQIAGGVVVLAGTALVVKKVTPSG